MLHRPKKRTWPSCIWRIYWNMRRQPDGERKGKSPSITSTSANASQSVLSSTPRYFLAGDGDAWEPPRMALKNSDVDGSSTITSPFFEKLDL